MEIASYTHPGIVRKNNEDSCLVIPPWSSLALNKRLCLFAVADGMGGQNAGEVASAIVIQKAKEWATFWKASEITNEDMEDLFGYVNSAVWEYSQKHKETSGMGTTFTVLAVCEKNAMIGHVGDSRLYLQRKGENKLLTNDHSLIGEQIRLGKISRDDARDHPARHILSRVIGGKQFIKPDIIPVNLERDDLILICSDGIYGMISEDVMFDCINGDSLHRVAKKLIEKANQAGGKDNSTAVLLKIGDYPINFPGKFSLSRLRSLITHLGQAGIG